MRVAVLNRGRDAFPGGDLVHIDSLTEAMKPLGVDRVYQPSETLTGEFDLFHIHHVNLSWCRMNFEAIKRFPKIPYIVTTIFYPTENLGVSYREIREWLDGAAAVVAYSQREEREIRERTLFSGQVDAVPPGVGKEFLHNAHDGWSQSRSGVLTVAARSGDKNCNLVEDCCRNLGLPYKQAIGVPRSELPQWYREARVFVNASGHESFGLTILEALASDCRVLATKHSWGLEWLPGIMSIDPQDERSLERAIEYAYKTENWWYLPNLRARFMSWELEADRMLKVYGAL